MTGVAPTVETTAGVVAGVSDAGIHRYLGIPYAAAPFGARRFRAPEQPEHWHGIRPCDTFGATAPQQEYANHGGLPDVPEPIIAGDDILTLNVWTSDVTPSTPSPVLVWIHGGGFTAGCSANPWYDGAPFARDGLVVVSLNYRLGIEGFLELPGADSNRAVRDWLAALRWVQDNISAFGGDPTQVTVMGQSAGGMAVSVLLTSPAATGLFHRAIIASGVLRGSVQQPVQAVRTAAAVAAALGLIPTPEALASVSPERMVEVQNALAERTSLLEHTHDTEETPLPWVPAIDHELVEQPVLDAVRGGSGARIPMLVGTTEHEFRWMAMRANPDDADSAVHGQQLTDALFRRPTEDFVQARKDAAPTYRYEFQWRSTAEPELIGSGHSIDIPFFFDTLDAPYVHPYTGPNPPQELADAMHGAFARFALTGDPGWPVYHSPNHPVMIFDTMPHLENGIHLND